MTQHNKYLILLFLLTIAFFSCSEDSPTGDVVTTEWVTKKVAIIAPLSNTDDYTTRVKQTVEWFSENLYKSQTRDSLGIKLEYEWFDESVLDMDSLAQALYDRDDILAIVGPFYSHDVDIMAGYCAKTKKPLLTPTASSEEVARSYAVSETGEVKRPFLWVITESDISQSEALLGKIGSLGGKSVALVSPDNLYGKTFYEWTPFIATELGLNMHENLQYEDGNFTQTMKTALQTDAEYLICVTNNVSEACAIVTMRSKMGDDGPKLLFADASLGGDLLTLGEEVVNGTEGVTMYANPTSGFLIQYQSRFGYAPGPFEAQLYDALLLVGFAANYNLLNGTDDLNQTICEITDGEGEFDINAWDMMGMTQYMAALKSGRDLNFKGASGDLRFDSEAYTSVLSTTYAHWMVYDGEIVILDYTSRSGTQGTTSNLASWYWQAQISEDIVDEDVLIDYGELRDRWAVLVSSSNSWTNYRHQSDVLNVYRMLKNFGYDDDHIILLMADDIAYNSKNKWQGQIYSSIGGENLYDDFTLDYRVDTMSVEDIPNILLGNKSVHLPKVLDTDEHSNVFFYWSSHGTEGSYEWIDGKAGNFSAADMAETVGRMKDENKFRKMFIVGEPCYSGGVISAVDGIQGVLGLSSATGQETSFAENRSYELGVWLSDRFTNNFVSYITANPSAYYRDLYLYLKTKTLGSHVSLHNYDCFGNMYKTSPKEFFCD